MIALLVVVFAAETPAAKADWTAFATPIIVAAVAALAAVAGTLGTIWVKKMNRPVDDAAVLKTHVEADKLRAEVELTRVTSDGKEVEIARGLLAEVRTELDRMHAEVDRVRADSERRIIDHAEISAKRHDELGRALDELKVNQERLLRRTAEHVPWDLAAAQVLRQLQPDFPAPPPLTEH